MPRATKDFSDIDPGALATRTFTFDFMPNPGGADTMMDAGETITAFTPGAWVLVALNNIDSSPSSRLTGSPQILGGTKVLQKIGNCIAGENYRVLVTVLTSASQTLTLWAHCRCVAPS